MYMTNIRSIIAGKKDDMQPRERHRHATPLTCSCKCEIEEVDPNSFDAHGGHGDMK